MAEKKRFRFAYALNEMANDGEAEIMIYSAIVSDKWRDSDPEVTAKEFDTMLKEAKNKGISKLRLRINSPGGDVWQATAMRAMLDNSSFDEINVDIEGLCASAATFFVCLPNAHVRIAKGSEFMIHNPWSCECGNARDFRRMADRLTNMENDQHEMYAERTGQSTEQIKEWMDAETWMTASEAVKNGFCDEIMNVAQAAACVTTEGMQLMREIYQCVPAAIEERKPAENISNGQTPVASSCPSEYKESNKEGIQNMEINEITMEQLKGGNPNLFQAIVKIGTDAERERIAQIDAMTDEGFEEMAREAKENGTSAADFLKNVVAERAGKKKNFLNQRKQETEPAGNVTGGSEKDNNPDGGANEMASFTKEMKELAQNVHAADCGMF